MLTKCQREFSNEWNDEISGESDYIWTQTRKQTVEIVSISSEARERPSAENAMREDAE
jgi:hypothetical protein